MKIRKGRWVALAGLGLLGFAMTGCSTPSAVESATSLYSQLGGSESIGKLANGFLGSSMSDPRLAGLLSKVDVSKAAPKVSDQLCAALGGGCQAPFTTDQVTAAASKLSPEQKEAVTENFGSSLGSITSNPMVRDAVTKQLGSKLGGIVGALL